jgi:hypothetical protein
VAVAKDLLIGCGSSKRPRKRLILLGRRSHRAHNPEGRVFKSRPSYKENAGFGAAGPRVFRPSYGHEGRMRNACCRGQRGSHRK